ncbi:PREDICTED: uncharacterized protein LOC109215818 [Nicotiana attenuata]|uniref:uncharacterized protein LOC109215818 n=1 Tax=Nicotiana attenuata TaxID=49451 RepID=UPI0009053D55|nr:PREDICTED: uncharacterized protein LOC109215818 [Nicotiana attenuata]
METPRQACWLIRKIFDSRKWYGGNDLCEDLQQLTNAGKFMIKKLALQRRLSTADRMAKWGIQVPMNCVLCNADTEETHTHLFFECDYSRKMWSSFLRWIGDNRQVGTWEEEIERLTTKQCNSRAHAEVLGWLLAATVYHVWNERNARRFQEQQQECASRLREITIQLHRKGQFRSNWNRLLDSLNSYPSLV